MHALASGVPPHLLLGVTRVTSLSDLGVILTDGLDANAQLPCRLSWLFEISLCLLTISMPTAMSKTPYVAVRDIFMLNAS